MNKDEVKWCVLHRQGENQNIFSDMIIDNIDNEKDDRLELTLLRQAIDDNDIDRICDVEFCWGFSVCLSILKYLDRIDGDLDKLFKDVLIDERKFELIKNMFKGGVK